MATAPIYTIPPDFEVIDPKLVFAAEASGWGVPKDTFDKVWARTTGKGIIIANLDSGVRSSHPLLQQPNKIIARRTFVGGDVQDDNGHGTMTATNSSGSHDNGDYVGVAPDSQLVVGKVFTAAGSGPSITDSVRWAADEGALVINYSGGGGSPYEPTRDAIQYANEKGCLVFCSSGNAGPNSKNWPAYFSNCVSVGAVRQDGRLASFSTTNQSVDCAAPGEQVTVGNRSGGYSKANGTSFSCPWMSGFAALVLQLRLQAGLPLFKNLDEFLAFLVLNSVGDVDPNAQWNYGVPSILQVLDSMANDRLVWF